MKADSWSVGFCSSGLCEGWSAERVDTLPNGTQRSKCQACARGSILACRTPIFTAQISKENVKRTKQLLSRKVSERKLKRSWKFVEETKIRERKNSRLVEHQANSSRRVLFIYLSVIKKVTRLLSCVVFCNSCETTWLWNPESTSPTQYNVRTCADVWPLCFIQYGIKMTNRLERLFNHLSLSDLFNVMFGLWHQCTCWTRQVSRTRHQSARPMVLCLMTYAITTSMRGFKSSSTTQCSVLRWNDTHRYLFILHNRMLDKASQNQNKNTSNHSHVGYALCSLPF